MNKDKAYRLLHSIYIKNFDLHVLIKICEAFFGKYHSIEKHPIRERRTWKS